MSTTSFFRRRTPSRSVVGRASCISRASSRSSRTPPAKRGKANQPFWKAVGGGIFLNDRYEPGLHSTVELVNDLIKRMRRRQKTRCLQGPKLLTRPLTVADEVAELLRLNRLACCKGADEIISTVSSEFHLFGADQEVEHAFTIIALFRGVRNTLLTDLVFLTDEWLPANAHSADWVAEGVCALINQNPFCLPPLCLWSLGQRAFPNCASERIGMAWADRSYVSPGTSAHQIWQLTLDSYFPVRRSRPRRKAQQRPLRPCTVIVWPVSNVGLCQAALSMPLIGFRPEGVKPGSDAARASVRIVGGYLTVGDAAALYAQWHSSLQSESAAQVLSSALHFALLPHSLIKFTDIPKLLGNTNNMLEVLEPSFYHAPQFAARNLAWLIAASARRQDKAWWRQAARVLDIDTFIIDEPQSVHWGDEQHQRQSVATNLMDTRSEVDTTPYTDYTRTTTAPLLQNSFATVTPACLDYAVGTTTKPQRFCVGSTISAPCGVAQTRKSWLTCRMTVPPPVLLDSKATTFAYILANATESKLNLHTLGVLAPCVLGSARLPLMKGLAYDFVSGLAYEVVNEGSLDLVPLTQRPVTAALTRPFLMQVSSAAAFHVSVTEKDIAWYAQKTLKLRLPIVWRHMDSEPLTFFLITSPCGFGLTGELGDGDMPPPALRVHCLMAPTGALQPRHHTSTRFARDSLSSQELSHLVGTTSRSPSLRSRTPTAPPSPLGSSPTLRPGRPRPSTLQPVATPQRTAATPRKPRVAAHGDCVLCAGAPPPDWRNGALTQERRSVSAAMPQNRDFQAGSRTLRAWQMLPMHMDFGAPGRLQRIRFGDRRSLGIHG